MNQHYRQSSKSSSKQVQSKILLDWVQVQLTTSTLSKGKDHLDCIRKGKLPIET
jgi:hypothetical protein